MPKNLPVMGSPEWAEQVFASPPVQELGGRSSWAQPHDYSSGYLKQHVTVQGRREYCTGLAIEYLVRLGYFKRTKPQPFKTDSEEFGAEIRPDFLAEAARAEIARYFVIETKAARFLTRVVHLALEYNRERFSEYGLQYLVWTDKRPLSHPVRHHLINMRAGADQYVTRPEVEKLVAWVKHEPSPNISRFYASGFDLDCLYAAAWNGEVFFPITRPMTPDTRLTLRPQEDLQAIFLDCRNRLGDWWSGLPAC